MNQPHPDEYPAFYQRYIDLVKNEDILLLLETQRESFPGFLRGLAHKAGHAYAEGKWTIRELLGHVIDTERIMAYRLLCIARGDEGPFPGFDENDYVRNGLFEKRDFLKLIEEFEVVRGANLYLFHQLTERELQRKGQANNAAVSARALLYMIAGHTRHHEQIISARYL